MTRVELAADLEERIAALIAPRVQEVVDEVAVRARENAPDAKVWAHSGDGRVRPSHREAAGAAIPANLRFQLPKMVHQSGAAGGWRVVAGFDLARRPRDPALPQHQRDMCRCTVVVVPRGVAAGVRPIPVVQTGPRVVGAVVVEFVRVAESEFPSGEDGGGGWLREAGRQALRGGG
ncbi:hypothetical protein GCM10022221_67210 [Actinocorallia aurea]